MRGKESKSPSAFSGLSDTASTKVLSSFYLFIGLFFYKEEEKQEEEQWW